MVAIVVDTVASAWCEPHNESRSCRTQLCMGAQSDHYSCTSISRGPRTINSDKLLELAVWGAYTQMVLFGC